MTPAHSVALTGFAAFCAAVISDPIVSFLLMAVILLTCLVVVVHILLSCWIANRKGAKRARIVKKPSIAQ